MNNLQKEKTLELLESGLKASNVENKDVVSVSLVWENKPLIADHTRERLLKDSKEKNIETLLNNLRQRFDVYTVIYGTHLPLYKKDVVQLDENVQTIVDNLLIEFNLTNLSAERERNREQVEQLTLDEDLKQKCYEYIENDLVTLIDDELIEHDGNIEELTTTIFTVVMFEMLYIEVAPPDLEGVEKFLKTFNL